MQDDDFLYKEETMKKMLSLSTPITGCHYRWCDGKRYAKKPLNGVKTKTAPLILTGGTLVNTEYLPGVISYAKRFWSEEEYQEVFNGEDIFMSRAISKISGLDEFPYVKDKFISLPTHNNQLYLNHNSIEDRIRLRNQIYQFFENINE